MEQEVPFIIYLRQLVGKQTQSLTVNLSVLHTNCGFVSKGLARVVFRSESHRAGQELASKTPHTVHSSRQDHLIHCRKAASSSPPTSPDSSLEVPVWPDHDSAVSWISGEPRAGCWG